MKIEFYGVRGSYPVPGEATNRYGGNTTCVSFSKIVDGKIKRIIIDCGTGAVPLGKKILGNYFAKKEDLDIAMLFTHLHPDHTQAFPFFSPNYFKDCSIQIMGMKTLKKHIGMVLESNMIPPTFPIEYKDLKSTRKHYELKDDSEFDRNGFNIKVIQSVAPSHPQQGAMYFRITDIDNGKSAACLWDLESKIGGDKAAINFSRDCDIMIHDTQYTKEEYHSDKMVVQGFGHSTYDMAIENAKQAGVKEKLICTHFNPAHDDNKLDGIQEEYKDKASFDIILAKEGMVIDL
ncbi:MAG: hypothetical protein GY754_31810 [bacterium]|nr:hypothetical protein [bacterium]